VKKFLYHEESKDRKMEDRKMFKSILCPDEHCFDGTKLYFSVSHFSVFAFVRANLTASSSNKTFQ